MSKKTINAFKQLFSKVSSKYPSIGECCSRTVEGLNKKPDDFRKKLVEVEGRLAQIIEADQTGSKSIDLEDNDLIELLTFISKNRPKVPEYECTPPLVAGDLSFEDIAGQTETKGKLMVSYIYPFQYPNLFKTLSKGTLLYGVPGTGKSLIARASVNEIEDAAFFNVSPANIRGKYEGETEKNIEKVFECARYYIEDESNEAKFAIIFFDEFDAIASDRADNPSMQRTVNMLLQMMDGIASSPNVSVLAATNYPKMLDDAILRRFTTRVFVDLPDQEAREYIIRDVLSSTFSNPNFSNEMKRNQVKPKEEVDEETGEVTYFYSNDTNYMINIETNAGTSLEVVSEGSLLSRKTEKTKIFDGQSITRLVEYFGPTKDGRDIIELTQKGTIVGEDDPRLSKPHIFGYSPSDIKKIMDIAISNASMRALSGYAIPKRFTIPGTDEKNLWWVFTVKSVSKIPEAKKISEMDRDEREKLVTFDIRYSDIEEAIRTYPSTVDNKKYLNLLKYSHQLLE